MRAHPRARHGRPGRVPEGQLEGGGNADSVDDEVCAEAAGEFLDCLDGVDLEEFTVWVAPCSRARASFSSSMSTAMMVVAPPSCAPAIAAVPTPPQPMTATDSPRFEFTGVQYSAQDLR